MKRIITTGFPLLVAAAATAQSYESTQGRATSRRTESWSGISRILGQGQDWLSYPTLDVSFNTQFQLDYQDFRAAGTTANLVNTSDLTTAFRFAPRLALYNDLTLDQIKGPNPGQNAWLDEEGIFSSSLFVQYSDQFVTIGGGQFTPDFGIANALAPGLYGGDFVGDYSFEGQVGVFGGLEFGDGEFGRHLFNGSIFTVDRSFLSDSLVTRRGRTSSADGGPGNSGKLDSFALSYNGVDVPIFSLPIFQYQLGFISQAEGVDGNARQYGYVAGLGVTIPLNRDALATAKSQYQALQPLIEYAHFDNWSGRDGVSADYGTTGLQYFHGDWNLNVSGTVRNTAGAPGADATDYLAQASIGYQLYGYQALGGNGQISLGWSYRREGGQYSNMVGMQLSLGWDLLKRFQVFNGW